jgi:hypothetical protein
MPLLSSKAKNSGEGGCLTIQYVRTLCSDGNSSSLSRHSMGWAWGKEIWGCCPLLKIDVLGPLTAGHLSILTLMIGRGKARALRYRHSALSYLRSSTAAQCCAVLCFAVLCGALLIPDPDFSAHPHEICDASMHHLILDPISSCICSAFCTRAPGSAATGCPPKILPLPD